MFAKEIRNCTVGADWPIDNRNSFQGLGRECLSLRRLPKEGVDHIRTQVELDELLVARRDFHSRALYIPA